MSNIKPQNKLSGGQVNYYLVQVKHPNREGVAPYQAECEDISNALKLTPDEFCIFKAIWRFANQRAHGNGKPGADEFGIYDGEKMVHYSKLELKHRREAKDDAACESRLMDSLNGGPSLEHRSGGLLSGMLMNNAAAPIAVRGDCPNPPADAPQRREEDKAPSEPTKQEVIQAAWDMTHPLTFPFMYNGKHVPLQVVDQVNKYFRACMEHVK